MVIVIIQLTWWLGRFCRRTSPQPAVRDVPPPPPPPPAPQPTATAAGPEEPSDEVKRAALRLIRSGGALVKTPHGERLHLRRQCTKIVNPDTLREFPIWEYCVRHLGDF